MRAALAAGMTPAMAFRQAADAATGQDDRREFIRLALHGYEATRGAAAGRYRSWEQARAAAAAAKREAVSRLDECLEEFERRFAARGGQVFWAEDGRQAADYVLEVARRHRVRSIVKSKTMTGDEIHLNEALEREGFSVVESDLGEFIQQLRQEPPFHFVFPCMHLRRGEISRLFEEKLGSQPAADPEELTAIARRWLRETYLRADMGISGANFLVADAGMISITENEGNARLTCALPRVHIAVVGIEKVVPRLSDLGVLLPMLATAGTGQPLTAYNTLYGGPRRPGEADGPEEFHVILLDNGRTRLLAEPQEREALQCIRCGACLNVCPVFKNVGGLSYGTPYQGPIGSVITPHLRGLRQWGHLSAASSLCGACTETCPVKIDLHHHLLGNRRHAVRAGGGRWEGWAWRAYAAVVRRPPLWRAVLRMARLLQPMRRGLAGGRLDPARRWAAEREVPELPRETFHEWLGRQQRP